MEGGEAAEGVMKRELLSQRVTRVTKEAYGVAFVNVFAVKSCSWPAPRTERTEGK